jgi:Putative peptidoglycan binding domain
MLRGCLFLSLAIACGSGGRATNAPEPAPPKPHSDDRCEHVLAFDDGRERESPCEGAIGDRTIVDLRDAWTPRLFAPGSDGRAPDFRATYLQLAAEHDANDAPLPPSLGLGELYGIVPSFAIVRQRSSETARYACHDKLESSAMAKLTRPYGEEHAGLVRVMVLRRKQLGAVLERARVERAAADYTAFATDKALGPTYAQWKEADDIYAGIVAAERRLACEGLLADKDIDGTFSWQLGNALELFQRRNFLIPNSRLDPDTRAALATDPRELDYRFALRVLRERVVDALGLIEDGSAGTGAKPILGRMLDPEAMRVLNGYAPLRNAAPDLIGPAVEAAARQLGWTNPKATAAFLAAHPGGIRVALALPKPPAYHKAHMELTAEIDRGDVWYDETPRVAWKRPALVLYLHDGKTKTPLIRWPSTIGGWSEVNIGGAIVKRWKESDVGPRVWRELYAAPTWFPPAATPDGELVRWLGPGKWELKKSIMGPGPMAAFGMMLLLHERAVRTADGKTTYVDNGIGTHGSAVVTSLLNGTSHGCHRLYNQLAVRLGSFLLAHRDHIVKGQQPDVFRRTINFGTKTFVAKLDTRGFLYELTPPIAVEVLPGNIRSERKVPPVASVAAGAE